VRQLCSLMHRKVVTESGRSLGRIWDLRAERTPRALTVTGLVVGRRGMLEHYGVVKRTTPPVPWSDVVRIEGKRIIVRS
jgi:sporulation protein YlmC with PRC-barrel domain